MISIVDATVQYPSSRIPALAHVDLRVEAGEFLFLVGPTGAGKSTFLRLLYRDLKPFLGRAEVLGHDLGHMRPRDIPRLRRKLGVVFQDYCLLPNKTAYENLAFALRVIGASSRMIRRRVPDALSMVGMAHRPDAFPHELSGGEQQRVAIARALVNEPPLLLADEPTGNLDPDTSLEIIDLLGKVNVRGTTVLVATHDALIVDRMQRRVVQFVAGVVVRDDARGVYRPEDRDVREVPVWG